MKKNRLIPIVLLKNGWLVQSRGFSKYQNLGNPTNAVRRISEWGSDELIYLDISKDDQYDIRRNDQNYPNRQSFFDIIEDVSKVTFMPITIGGKIEKLQDIEKRLKLGADKIAINSKAINDAGFIEKSAREFGAQCIVVSIDVKIDKNNYVVYDHKNSCSTDLKVLDFSKHVESLGAGEILLNSVDRDGKGNGYDIDLLNLVSNQVKIPVIACGGVGKWNHFQEALEKTKVDAVAAANIFNYIEHSVYYAKKFLYENNFKVRKPELINLKERNNNY